MNYTQTLLSYLQQAPEEIQQRCNIYYENPEPEERQIYTNRDECIFNGLIFRDNYVGVYNIQMYNVKNWDKPYYYNAFDLFQELTKYYNVYHAALILSLEVGDWKKDNVLLEQNYLHFKYYDRQILPRLNYNATKHRNREGKFIDSHKSGVQTLQESKNKKGRGNLYNILYQSCTKEDFYLHFRQFRNQRPNTMFFQYGNGSGYYNLLNKKERSREIPRKQKGEGNG